MMLDIHMTRYYKLSIFIYWLTIYGMNSFQATLKLRLNFFYFYVFSSFFVFWCVRYPSHLYYDEYDLLQFSIIKHQPLREKRCKKAASPSLLALKMKNKCIICLEIFAFKVCGKRNICKSCGVTILDTTLRSS